MATVNSTATKNLIDVSDLLSRINMELSFIQSIALEQDADYTLTLNPDQLAGFYYVIGNVRSSINKAIEQITNDIKTISK